jgi:5'(3')-deoxyribonucleotidase
MGNVDIYGNCWNCLGKPLLVSDHWFAHRIQHGSGGKVNVKISERYVVSSLWKITDGEELFMDYNRDCKYMKYDVWCKYFFPPFLYNHFVLCVEKNLIHASSALNVTNAI